MTANELADALEDKSIRYSESVQDWLDDAKNMIRQQAEEIKVLEALGEDYFQSMHIMHIDMIHQQQAEIRALKEALKLRELTDEEIDELMNPYLWHFDRYKFARAILKKASEK